MMKSKMFWKIALSLVLMVAGVFWVWMAPGLGESIRPVTLPLISAPGEILVAIESLPGYAIFTLGAGFFLFQVLKAEAQ